MTVCRFYLQGRCHYGDKCWNEHPRGPKGPPGQPSGSVHRVWVNPSQRPGGSYVQPSSFSHGGNEWSRQEGGGGGGGGGGGSQRDVRSSNFSFTNQNKFSALNSQSSFDRDRMSQADDNDKNLEAIQKDMEVWQSSGQWPFSCYALLKAPITGFVELSSEELRLQYYTSRAAGDLQTYVNSVQQLVNQWVSRVQELRTMNSSTRAAMTLELNNQTSETSSSGGFFSSSSTGFGSSSGSSSSGFGGGGFGTSTQSSGSFNFKTSSSGFGSASTQPASAGFGSVGTQPASTGFGSVVTQPASTGFGSVGTQPASTGFGSVGTQPASTGFGFGSSVSSVGSAPSSSTPSASSFSFAPTASKGPMGGSSSAAGFSFSSSTVTGSTGSTGGTFGFGGGSVVSAGATGDQIYTPRGDLTADELKEFTAQRFTLGQIPLRPPPAELLAI